MLRLPVLTGIALAQGRDISENGDWVIVHHTAVLAPLQWADITVTLSEVSASTCKEGQNSSQFQT